MAIKSCYPFTTQYFCAKVVDNFIKKRLDLRSVFANTLDASHRSIVTTLSWWLEVVFFWGMAKTDFLSKKKTLGPGAISLLEP